MSLICMRVQSSCPVEFDVVLRANELDRIGVCKSMWLGLVLCVALNKISL